MMTDARRNRIAALMPKPRSSTPRPQPSSRPQQRRSERAAPHEHPGQPSASRNEGQRAPREHRGRGRQGGKPGGPYWLAGVHAVQAALENPARTILRVLLTTEARPDFIERLSTPLPASVETTDRAHLAALLGAETVHQGVAALVEPLEAMDLEDALERPGPILVLDQVTDPRNVGAILRSAAAFGAACIVMQDRHAPDEGTALAKAASGALEIVPLIRVVNLARSLETLKRQDIWTIGLDAGGSRLNGSSLGGRRAALVLGSEGDGLRRLTREACDEIAGVYMPGHMESLNVSVAAAVGLYELIRTN
nr:23S rRNA (guanosine(2251)-2'-O)-methyltransferase RlmB [Acetobacter nitrogenifigens]